jgi:ABC-2 type transport system ATP-binding protein
MGSPAVEVDNLVQRFGAVTALDGLSFTLDPGQVLALLGPNGAGKTTTLEICEGFRRPTAGTARVLGVDPVGRHDDLMPRIGVMLQSGGVYPGARAGEMLALAASYAARPLELGMLIERLGLAAVLRTPYRRLSGGEKQRLSLAIALVGRPELVFLDEPTAGMDPQARRATWELVEELRRDGVAVLLTTHFLDEAEYLADDVVIVDAGRVVAQGPPATLVAGDVTVLRLVAEPGLSLVVAGLSVQETSPGVYLLSGTITADVVAAVANWCAGHGVLPREITLAHRTLEDVFLDLTGKELRP